MESTRNANLDSNYYIEERIQSKEGLTPYSVRN